MRIWRARYGTHHPARPELVEGLLCFSASGPIGPSSSTSSGLSLIKTGAPCTFSRLSQTAKRADIDYAAYQRDAERMEALAMYLQPGFLAFKSYTRRGSARWSRSANGKTRPRRAHGGRLERTLPRPGPRPRRILRRLYAVRLRRPRIRRGPAERHGSVAAAGHRRLPASASLPSCKAALPDSRRLASARRRSASPLSCKAANSDSSPYRTVPSFIGPPSLG